MHGLTPRSQHVHVYVYVCATVCRGQTPDARAGVSYGKRSKQDRDLL